MALNSDSHVPIFKQIVEHIRTGIASGIHRPGEMLPSLRALAVELMVNPNTVQRAYEELEREGLVYSRKGIGLFVAERGVKFAQKKSQKAVERLFSDGIAAGRAANLSDDEIQLAFAKELAKAPQRKGAGDGRASETRRGH